MHKIWMLKFYSHLQNKSHLLACICGILKRERLWKETDIMFDGFARASVPMLARALVSASDWEPPVVQPYAFTNGYVQPFPWFFPPQSWFFGVIFLEKMLWQLCREAKEASHLTNQAIADRAGLALNTVSQYLRGESKSASVYTVGPICYALGIDMNAYFGISPPAPESVSELLRLENKSLRTQRDQLRKSLKMHRITTLVLLGIVALCAFALVVDILSPNLGWFRA